MTIPAWAKGTLLLTVTLAAGIAIGVGYERRRVPPHEMSGRDSHHLIRGLSEQLELDSAQYAAVAAILARRQGAVDSTWRAMRPRMHATLDSTMREILGVLRPDQAAKYREMLDTMHPGALTRDHK